MTNKYLKGSKELITGWAFYDWANSVYSLVISTAIFPIYYSSLAKSIANNNGSFNFLGAQWNADTLLSYSISFYMLIVAFISPILSGIADYSGNKLKFLKIFCWLGAISVMCLFFFQNQNTFYIGILCTITAGVGFWGSIVFYNAFLPEVAYPEQQNNASAKGFIFGYFGSVILLVICLLLIETKVFGYFDKAVGSRISFLLVGLWWLGFAQITYSKLSVLPRISKNKDNNAVFWNGFKELRQVFNEIKKYKQLKVFLWSFLFYSVGAQTIIYMAAIFGSSELGLPSLDLILTIILVQIIAALGAYLFSVLSNKIGNIATLKITIASWGVVCFIAFLINKDLPNVKYYFYFLGGLLGLVLGALQSISRATYSKLLPDTTDTATYFSFYDVTEKIAMVFGTLVFGLLIDLTGSMQWSVLSLAIFFVTAFVILSFIRKTKYVN